MNNQKLTRNMPKFLTIIMFACLLVSVALFFYLYQTILGDLRGHWPICRYTLEGINPYPLIGQPAAVEAIGTIPPAFSTVPWSCVFGSAFYAGFLPFEWAYTYNFVLHFASLVALMVAIYKTFKDILPKNHMIIALLVPGAHFSFLYSVNYENAGGIICCWLMIAFLIGEKHPYISGILLGFAMMKPQITGIICLVYLLRKQWKQLFTAAAIVIAGWAATCILTSTGPVELLIQTLESGTAAETQYLGLFNNLKYFGVDSTVILLINVAVGGIYTLAVYFWVNKKANLKADSLFAFVPACIASTFWIYKNGTDYMVVAFVALLVCVLYVRNGMSIADYIIAILSIGYLEMSRCAVYLGVVIFEDNLFIRDLFKSGDGLLIAIAGIFVCRLWIKYNGESMFLKAEKEA